MSDGLKIYDTRITVGRVANTKRDILTDSDNVLLEVADDEIITALKEINREQELELLALLKSALFTGPIIAFNCPNLKIFKSIEEIQQLLQEGPAFTYVSYNTATKRSDELSLYSRDNELLDTYSLWLPTSRTVSALFMHRTATGEIRIQKPQQIYLTRFSILEHAT